MDPLRHEDSTSSEEKSRAYLRGFYDAEKRKKLVNIDPTWGQAIGGAMIGGLPFVLTIYFMTRRTRLAQQAAAGSNLTSNLWTEMQKAFERSMNPLGRKDFRVAKMGTRFADVIGVPEALAEVQQYVDFLRTPDKFTRLGGHLPKGCILTGQPGTGKTLLAKAVAGEANVPFFSCSGADFIEVFAGSGPMRVRELFEAAKTDAPSVVFIDEIDAVGSRSSGNGAMGLSSEENRTVNQLLAELDGLQASDTVVVFAATNFVENLDRALLREGRFDRKVEVPMPDSAAREELFTHYLKKSIVSDVQTEAKRMAELTPGVSPATIAAIVNEAALSAAISGKEAITSIDLLPAIDDVLIGKKHRNRMTPGAAERVALHESGHTLIAWLLPEQSDVIKVSITPRGPAAGFTQQVGREALDMPTEYSMFTDICVMLGGRLAELTQHDDLTTGAQDDYQRATQTAVLQFLAFGMSPQGVGLLAFESERLAEGRLYQKHSEETQKAAEHEAARLVAAAYEFVQSVLRNNEQTLKKVAAALYQKGELLRADLEELIGPRGKKEVTVTANARAALTSFTRASEEAGLSRSTSRESIMGASL